MRTSRRPQTSKSRREFYAHVREDGTTYTDKTRRQTASERTIRANRREEI